MAQDRKRPEAISRWKHRKGAALLRDPEANPIRREGERSEQSVPERRALTAHERLTQAIIELAGREARTLICGKGPKRTFRDSPSDSLWALVKKGEERDEDSTTGLGAQLNRAGPVQE